MTRVLALALSFSLALPALADEVLEKPVNKLVKSVRFEKDDLALASLDGEAEGEVLLGEAWAKGTDAQRKEFVSLFHQLFAAMAFPKIRENFKNLDTTLYEPTKAEGDKVELKSTLVINHPLKKQEIKVKYDLRKVKEGWRVVDVTVLGSGSPSMLSGIRDEQIKPLLANGGWDKLLQVMRDRLAQVKPAKK
jgi:phospholipid transport system substrate-binding protein